MSDYGMSAKGEVGRDGVGGYFVRKVIATLPMINCLSKLLKLLIFYITPKRTPALAVACLRWTLVPDVRTFAVINHRAQQMWQ